jgi:integrase
MSERGEGLSSGGAESVEQTSLVLRFRPGADGKTYCDAQWRYRLGSEQPWRFRKQRLGLVWLEDDGEGGWRKRKGRRPDGWLDERGCSAAAFEAMQAYARELATEAERLERERQHRPTVRELAFEWLDWLEHVKGAKPSTVADSRFLLREPGEPHKRGGRVSPGRVMAALGDKAVEDVKTSDLSRFLRTSDAEGLTARNVNKHRQLLHAMFSYGCREDSLALQANPVTATDKRREDPPPALDYYEVEEVEALARVCEQGAQRVPRRLTDSGEIAARTIEDRQDAEAFRLLFYTGLRLGEMLALRWDDVDFEDRVLLVRRAVSSGKETLPKGRRHRFVPLSRPAVEALVRLASRDEFTGPEDYVLCNRWGRRIDGSALRSRYARACKAAGLRHVRLHGLRHAAGSLVARTTDAVFVRDFLGHEKLSTTDRYVSAKLRPEELEQLDQAFRRRADEAVSP